MKPIGRRRCIKAEQIDGLHFTDAEDDLDGLEGFDW